MIGLISCSLPVSGQKHGEESQLGKSQSWAAILEQQRPNSNHDGAVFLKKSERYQKGRVDVDLGMCPILVSANQGLLLSHLRSDLDTAPSSLIPGFNGAGFVIPARLTRLASTENSSRLALSKTNLDLQFGSINNAAKLESALLAIGPKEASRIATEYGPS
jgi:hypothetical protein